MSVALILLSFYDDAKIDAKGNRECEIRFFAYRFARIRSFNFVSTRLVETGFKKTRTRTRGIKTKLRTKEMRRDRDNKLSIFIEFGRNCPLPPLPVLSVSLRPIIIHGSDFCSLYTYNSHPFWESLATETWEKEERLKKKKKEEGKRKRNLSFVEGSRIPHSLVAWLISQPVLAFFSFLFFSILFFIFERKIDGLITVLRSARGEGEDVSAREATGSTCSSLLRHCYSTEVAQNTRFPLFVTVSRAYGFALRPRLLSICRVEKCLDRVSISKNFGWLTWQPSNEQPLNVKESWRFVRTIVFRIRLSEIHQPFE